MKYYKQWTLTETLLSVSTNLRKVYGEKYIFRLDYNQILIWTQELEPKLKTIVFVEPTFSASQAAFNELIPQEGVRRFRVAGSFTDIADKFKDVL